MNYKGDPPPVPGSAVPGFVPGLAVYLVIAVPRPELPVICPCCEGDGYHEAECVCPEGDHDVVDCPDCQGTGRLLVPAKVWAALYGPRLRRWRELGAAIS